MGVTETIFSFIKPHLEKAEKGLSRAQCVDLILKDSKGRFSYGQCTGAMETASRTGMAIKVHNGTMNPHGNPMVIFTLPDLELTKDLPRVGKQPKKPNPLSTAPLDTSGVIPESGNLTLSESVLTVIEARPNLSRPELLEFCSQLLKCHAKSIKDALWRMTTTNKIIAIGRPRTCRFLITGGREITDGFSDAELLRLVKLNPKVIYSDMIELVGLASGRGKTKVYNQFARLRNEKVITVDGGFMSCAESLEEVTAPDSGSWTPLPGNAPEEARTLPPIAPPPPAVPAPAPLGVDFTATLQSQINALAASMAGNIAAQVAQGIAQALGAMQMPPPAQVSMPAIPAPAGLPVPSIAAPQKRVTVIGLLGQQAALLQSEFPGVHFDFVSADNCSGGRAGEVIKNADKVYAMTKFISHAIESQVKSHPHYERIQGGMTSLRDALKRYMLVS